MGRARGDRGLCAALAGCDDLRGGDGILDVRVVADTVEQYSLGAFRARPLHSAVHEISVEAWIHAAVHCCHGTRDPLGERAAKGEALWPQARSEQPALVLAGQVRHFILLDRISPQPGMAPVRSGVPETRRHTLAKNLFGQRGVVLGQARFGETWNLRGEHALHTAPVPEWVYCRTEVLLNRVCGAESDEATNSLRLVCGQCPADEATVAVSNDHSAAVPEAPDNSGHVGSCRGEVVAPRSFVRGAVATEIYRGDPHGLFMVGELVHELRKLETATAETVDEQDQWRVAGALNIGMNTHAPGVDKHRFP